MELYIIYIGVVYHNAPRRQQKRTRHAAIIFRLDFPDQVVVLSLSWQTIAIFMVRKLNEIEWRRTFRVVHDGLEKLVVACREICLFCLQRLVCVCPEPVLANDPVFLLPK